MGRDISTCTANSSEFFDYYSGRTWERMQSTRRSYYESGPRPSFDWDIGETPDQAVLSKNGKLQWNDKFPVSSPPFLAWTTIKFLLALGIAAAIANDIALRFVAIKNYLVQTNGTWFA